MVGAAGNMGTKRHNADNADNADVVSHVRERNMVQPPVRVLVQDNTEGETDSARRGLDMLGDERAGLSGGTSVGEGWFLHAIHTGGG